LVGVTVARVIKAYYGQNFPVISDLAHALLPSIGILIDIIFIKEIIENNLDILENTLFIKLHKIIEITDFFSFPLKSLRSKSKKGK
jgi:hypothetical protein